MQLTGKDVEEAFVATALEQDGGEFNWPRVADRLNRRIGELTYARRAAFILADRAPAPGPRANVGVDGRTTDNSR